MSEYLPDQRPIDDLQQVEFAVAAFSALPGILVHRDNLQVSRHLTRYALDNDGTIAVRGFIDTSETLGTVPFAQVIETVFEEIEGVRQKTINIYRVSDGRPSFSSSISAWHEGAWRSLSEPANKFVEYLGKVQQLGLNIAEQSPELEQLNEEYQFDSLFENWMEEARINRSRAEAFGLGEVFDTAKLLHIVSVLENLTPEQLIVNDSNNDA